MAIASPTRDGADPQNRRARNNRRYAAFLSYARGVDSVLATALRDSLQRFAKPWHKPRALRVFRDDSALSASPSLWPSIFAAMDDSRYFILLASPAAAASRPVAAEVEHWLATNGPDTLLIALTDGDIAWDPATNDFDRAVTTSIPPTLYGRLPHEPRWVDLRPFRGAREISLRVPLFRDAIADLAAPLHGVVKDDIIGTDIRQHTATRRVVGATIATLVGLMSLAIASTIFAVDRAKEAENERSLAVSRLLVANADTAISFDPRTALQFSLAANSIRDDAHTRASLIRSTLGQDVSAFTTSLVNDTGGVTALAYSPDGRTLVTADNDGAIVFWDASSGHPRRVGEAPRRHSDLARAVAYFPDGRTLATAGNDGEIFLWDVSDPAAPQLVSDALSGHDDDVRAVAVTPDGMTLATAGLDRHVILWDVTDPGQPKRREAITVDYAIYTIAISHDGRTLVVGGGDRDAGSGAGLTVWDITDLTKPQLLQKLTAHRAAVGSLAFSPDDRTLATASDDESVILWDISDRADPRPYDITLSGHEGTVWAVTFSPDGRTIATGGNDHRVILWDVTDPAWPVMRRTLAGHTGAVVALAYVPNQNVLASGSMDRTVIPWSLDGAHAPTRVGPELRGASPSLQVLVVSPDGALIATGGADGVVTLWDTTAPDGPAQIATIPAGPGTTLAVEFSPDGATLAAAGTDRTISLWDISDPRHPSKRETPLAGHAGFIRDLAFSPDGRTLASASLDHTITLWDVTDPDRPAMLGEPLRGHDDMVLSVAFSPNGRLLASGGRDMRVIIWDVSDPARPEPIGDPIQEIADTVSVVAFSPDGLTVAIGGFDQAVRLMDVSVPEHPRRSGPAFLAGPGPVWTLSFAPTGTMLAVGSELEIRLVDITDPTRATMLGEPLRLDPNHFVTSVSYAPDGSWLAASTDGGAVVRWDLGPLNAALAKTTELACTMLGGRGMAAEDWARFVPGEPFRETCPAGD